VFSGFNTPGTFSAQDGQHFSILRTTKVNGLNPKTLRPRKSGMRVKMARKSRCSSSITNRQNLTERQPRFNTKFKREFLTSLVCTGYGGFGISADAPFCHIFANVWCNPRCSEHHGVEVEWHRRSQGMCAMPCITEAAGIGKHFRRFHRRRECLLSINSHEL